MSKFMTGKDKTCERCARKPADLVCPLCQPLKYFCSSCDIAVHALVTKKSHQRDIIKEDSDYPVRLK